VVKLDDVAAIALGSLHGCALGMDGRVKCWGWSGNGQAGPRTGKKSWVPELIPELSRAVAIDANSNNSCVIVSDGTVKCWGSSNNGELGPNFEYEGDGSEHSDTPVTIGGLPKVKDISVGPFHMCAVAATDGAVDCWGWNGRGQLGNGTESTAPGPIPGRVLHLADATQVSAGVDHTCALLAAQTVVCWGSNDDGQLGDGTMTSSSEPVPVVGLTSVTAVVTGFYDTCALRTDGTVACWGQGYTPTATPFVGLSDVTQLVSGSWFNCAVLSSGDLVCWGDNHYGSLGDGTTTDSYSTPVQVLFDGRRH
jgi:alpha-tubulin suppressor-like RCC1 family protein